MKILSKKPGNLSSVGLNSPEGTLKVSYKLQNSGLGFECCVKSQTMAFWLGREWKKADSADGGSRWEEEKKMLLGEARSKNSPDLNLPYLCSRLVGKVQTTTQRKDLQC